MRSRLFVMRNEDYDRELLAIVTSFCVLFAIAVSVFDAGPSMATSTSQASMSTAPSTATPVRVVGTPFVPNTNPGLR